MTAGWSLALALVLTSAGLTACIPGLKRSDAWRYMHELLPAVKALWEGDYEHKGEFWSFPTSTSVPKAVQKPHPSIWVAARAPITYDYAVKHGCNIMAWPLTRPMSEAELYRDRLAEAMEVNPRPCPANLRDDAVRLASRTV